MAGFRPCRLYMKRELLNAHRGIGEHIAQLTDPAPYTGFKALARSRCHFGQGIEFSVVLRRQPYSLNPNPTIRLLYQ